MVFERVSPKEAWDYVDKQANKVWIRRGYGR
jgi:hypothetical protein